MTAGLCRNIFLTNIIRENMVLMLIMGRIIENPYSELLMHNITAGIRSFCQPRALKACSRS